MVNQGETCYNYPIEKVRPRADNTGRVSTQRRLATMSNHTQLPLPLPDTTIEILLTHGHVAIIDAIDADLLEFKWRAFRGKNSTTFYAVFTTSKGYKMIHLHRVILARILNRELLSTEFVDHKDCDGLNCVRGNLRLASNTENSRNQRISSRNTSGYKGVTWNKKSGKWQAGIKFDGKSYHLGLFDDPALAHAAYCEKAKELFGEFARFE